MPVQRTNYGQLASRIAQRLMEKPFLHFVGKLPRSVSANGHILAVLDVFNKFCWLVPVKAATARIALGILGQIFASLGCPVSLITDNVTQFTSREFKRFCIDSGI